MTENHIFFAFVADSLKSQLYLGHGDMVPTGTYVLLPVDISEKLDAALWLGETVVEAFMDVMFDFDVHRDLFKMPYQPNKKDWEDLTRAQFISRTVWSPQDAVIFLERVGVDAVTAGIERAEATAHEADTGDSRADYDNVEKVYAAKKRFDHMLKERDGVNNRRILADALKNKLNKMKGGQ